MTMKHGVLILSCIPARKLQYLSLKDIYGSKHYQESAKDYDVDIVPEVMKSASAHFASLLIKKVGRKIFCTFKTKDTKNCDCCPSFVHQIIGSKSCVFLHLNYRIVNRNYRKKFFV